MAIAEVIVKVRDSDENLVRRMRLLDLPGACR